MVTALHKPNGPNPASVAGPPTSENGSGIDVPTKPQKNPWNSLWTYMKAEISLAHADVPIIATCVVSGLCDSSSYNAWSCFVSMQTGNTIFLALGASGQPASKPNSWIKSLTSILLFLLGCLFFSSSRLFHPKSRGILAASFFLQSCCIIIAAALVQGNFVPQPKGAVVVQGPINYKELLPLGFLAFQSGGQIVSSRLLGFNEVPTTVLTSVYCDLASDPKLFKRDNVKRNRRVAAVISLLVGGIIGGWISRSPAGIATNFWIAAAIKMSIALGWSVWKPASPITLP